MLTFDGGDAALPLVRAPHRSRCCGESLGWRRTVFAPERRPREEPVAHRVLLLDAAGVGDTSAGTARAEPGTGAS